MITGFRLYHPGANFIYFTGLLILAMLLMEPVSLGILLIGVLSYGLVICGRARLFQGLKFSVPIGLIMVLVNPLINHRGRHILFELFGKPVTLEALLMGIMMAVSLIIIITMFITYEAIVDYHKFIYMVGKVLPKTAFLTTMTIRYIPLLKRRYEIISFTRDMIVTDHGHIVRRISVVNQKILMLLGWSVESAITTADSMTARGYGLVKRSHYRSYTWHIRDILYSLVSVIILIVLVYVRIQGRLVMPIYPNLIIRATDQIDLILYGCLLAFVNLPLWIEWKEQLRWHYSKSRI